MKTFYIETFGCQMNAHDSEKVVGTLISEGYTQVVTPDEAELVFYNTCSIREKAAHKLFSRLGLFDPNTLGQELEERYGIPRRRLTGTGPMAAAGRRLTPMST